MDDARLRIARISVAKKELLQVLRQVCEISARTLDVERVGIWFYAPEKSAIRCACLFEKSKAIFSEGAVLHAADFPAYFASLEVRKTIPAEHADFDPRTSELEASYLTPLNITSMIDAPIMVNGEVRGVVCHEQVGTTREWSTEERDFAGSVADLIALKIKGAELEQLRGLLRERETDRAALREHEAVARMAAGVAHDFKNFLTVVLTGAEQILQMVPKESEAAEVAQNILHTAERGIVITRDLMAIGRRQAARPKILQPAEVIGRFLHMLHKAVGQMHQIHFHAAPHVGRVLMDAAQLERLLLNLVLNARDAMTEGGAIHVSVANEPSAGKKNPGAGRVVVRVEDTGGGIAPGVLDKIFEPYFTTKTQGRGTGLGLTMVRQAVEHAGGELRVENHPGTGVAFVILLPRLAGE